MPARLLAQPIPVHRPQHPLRTIRLVRGITQAQLSALSMVSCRTIHGVEKWEHRKLQYGTQRRLLNALGLPWDDRRVVFPTLEDAIKDMEAAHG